MEKKAEVYCMSNLESQGLYKETLLTTWKKREGAGSLQNWQKVIQL